MAATINKKAKIIEQLYKTNSVDSEHLELFLTCQPNLAERQLVDSKSLYDLSRSLRHDDDILSELIVDGFDAEQVWQQVEMANGKLGANSKRMNRLIKESLPSNEIPEKKRKDHNDDKLEVVSAKKVRFENMDQMSDTEEVDEISDAEVANDISYDDDSDDGSDIEDNELKALLKKVIENEKNNGDDDDKDDGDDDDDNSEKDEDDNNDDIDDDADDSGDDDEKDDKLDNDAMTAFKKSLQNGKKTGEKKKSLKVEDKFFKLSSMEDFLNKQDSKEQRRIDGANEMKNSDDEDEEDDDISSDEEASNIKYEDFFDPPNKELDSEDESVDEEDSEGENETTDETKKDRELIPDPSLFSSFEKRKTLMHQKINELEESNLAEKSWQLMGEVSAAKRPENSLMEEVLEYDTTSKPAMMITKEVEQTIEEKILQRLKDNVWDGPKRKVRVKESAFTIKKKIVLDQEKSKISLEKIYEDEYLQQTQKQEEQEPPEFEAIKTSMTALFKKLDALSNFHFTPKPAVPDMVIISNVSSITMEEVAPVAVSDAAMLAPEEIMEKSTKGLIGAGEQTKTDKLRSRRSKKRRQHFKRLDQEKREKLKKEKSEKNDKLKILKMEEKSEKKTKKTKSRKDVPTK